jgi:hypothetical protein
LENHQCAIENTKQSSSLFGLRVFCGENRLGIWLVLTLLLSAAYMYAWTNAGWLPEDDGVLAQSALRVMQGQLPHRDFAETYTGGLSYLNAEGFRILGVSLVTLRIVMFLLFLAWVPAVFYIASRIASPLAAAGITLAAVAWSVPNYPTPMPSWYNLFFAVFGAAAIFRSMETHAGRWLFLAGICGGLSFDAKVTGMYYIAAVLLFLVYREQESQNETNAPTGIAYVYRIFVIGALAAFLAALVMLVRRQLDNPDITHFLLPSLFLVVLLIAGELRSKEGSSLRRFRALFGMIAPFGLGFLIAVGALLAPYALSSSLGAFARGVFTAGLARAQEIAGAPPSPAQLLFLPAVLLLAIALAILWERAAGWAPAIVTAVALSAGLFLVDSPAGLLRVWLSVSLMTPLVVALGAGVLHLRPVYADALSPLRRQQLMLLLALAALCSIVQFPFAAPIYFCYCAPLTGLALLALTAVRRHPANRLVLTMLLAAGIVFAAVRITPRYIYRNFEFRPDSPPLQSFHLPRAAGLRGAFAGNYETAAKIVREHSPNGLLIATPESPELYFLSGLRNPTGNDLGLSPGELSQVIDRPDLNVVAINLQPIFPQNLPPPALARRLAGLFPHSQRVGRYWIGWKN